MLSVKGVYRPLVSVVIVTYNRKNDLKEAIESARAQSYDKVEIVVVDNNSADGTIDLLRDEFPAITTVRLAQNGGPCVGRNVGAAKATGDILFFLDDDATLDSDAIHRIVQRFSLEPGLAVIVSQILDANSGNPDRSCPRAVAGPLDEEFYLPEMGNEGATAFRREGFRRAGGWAEHLVQCSEGRDLSYRILDAGYRIVYFPPAVAHHRLSPLGNQSRERIAYRKAYLTIRNELWITWTYLPVSRAVLETAIKVVYYPLASARQGTLLACLRGILAACKSLPLVLRTRRRPIHRDTLAKVDRMMQGDVVQDPRELEGIAPVNLLRFLTTKWRLLRDPQRIAQASQQCTKC